MLYFIRHAESAFNLDADVKLREQMGQKYCKKSSEYKQLKFDPKYADCGLTENGEKQCLKAHEQMKHIPVNLVLVSPMRRALETCKIIFKDHPSKPKIVVDPNVRQIFSSSCDIGSRLIESMQDFKQFDFGLIQRPQCWYIQSIRNLEIRKQLESRLAMKIKQRKIDEKQKKQVNEAAFQVMMEYLQQNFGKISQNTFSNFESQKQRLKQMAEKYESVAVVSHHDNIITYTNRPTKNCEVLKFPASQL